MGQGVLHRRGLRIHRETTASGGSKPRRNRNSSYGRACGGGVSVTWSPDLPRPSAPPLGLSSFLPQLVAAKRVLVKTLMSFSHKFPPKGLRLVGKELW